MSRQEGPIWRSPTILIGGSIVTAWLALDVAGGCSEGSRIQQVPPVPANQLFVPIETKPLPQKQNYGINKRVIIKDNDTKYQGIFLRPSPAGDIYPDTPAVFDGDDVEIIEGPSVIKRQNWNKQGEPFLEDFNWWKVRIYFQVELGRTKVGRQTGAEGWISEEWFGRIIPVKK